MRKAAPTAFSACVISYAPLLIKPVRVALVAALSWLALSAALPAAAQSPLSLATEPLANTPPRVKPNLMFVLDDSGSMEQRYTPDYIDDSRSCYRFSAAALVNGTRGCAEGEPPFGSPIFNYQYYNPAIRYLPGVDVATQSDLPSQNSANTTAWTRVRTDAYGGTGTTDITRAIPDRAYCETNYNSFDPLHCVFNVGPYVLPNSRYPNLVAVSNAPHYHSAVSSEYCTDNELTSCRTQSAPSANYSVPAMVRWCNSSKRDNCRARQSDTYNYAKFPTGTAASVLLTFTRANSGSQVRALRVGGVDILNGVTVTGNTPEELAAALTAAINAFINVGAIGDISAVGETDLASLRLYAPAAAGTAANGVQVVIDTNANYSFSPRAELANGTSGGLSREFIIPTRTAYPKSAARTDCAGASCTYEEEMTNFANWFTYHRTRMQTMKSAVGRAFSSPLVVGNNDAGFRVGLMTINDTTGSRFINVSNFYDAAKREAWYRKFYSITPNGSTPLRGALSRVGRMYGGFNPYPTISFTDPVTHSCQQNITLLTTDGYWNETGAATTNRIVKLDGTSLIGNQDNTEPRPYFDGAASGICPGDSEGTAGTTCNTLADVALYYYKTDLRTMGLNNCISNGRDVCSNNVPSSKRDPNNAQHMVTFTLGLGVDGTLRYRDDYDQALTGDYADIAAGRREWPAVKNLHPTAVDDLWHAAVNGRGKYLNARDPVGLGRAIDAALADAQSIIGAGSAAAASSLEPVAGDNYVYLAGYATVEWTGNLEARTIDPQSGAISTTSNWCAENISINQGQTTVCTGTMPSMVSATADRRTIYTFSATATRKLRNFLWSDLSTAERNLFSDISVLSQASGFTAEERSAAAGTNLVNFLRGQNGFEDREGNPYRIYRQRKAVLGDIVGGRPVFVGQPQFDYTDDGYTSFKGRRRDKMVYVAGNDGMLHAFDAATGVERWAYVPTQLFSQMRLLADKNYDSRHVFLNDGAPVVGDIYDGRNWRTILVGGFNAGARGYYALDISDPANPQALWELSAANENDLGYSFGNPLIVKDPSNRWRVLLTSGYNNISPGSGRGVLFVVDPITGAVAQRIASGAGSMLSPSGLSRMTAYVDSASVDNKAQYVYAGDLLGHLWRFDLLSNTAVRLASFTDTSGVRQPITTRPLIGTVNNERFIVLGTGKLLESVDRDSAQTQTIYGFVEKFDTDGSIDAPRTVMVQQTLSNGTTSDGRRVRTASNNSVDFGIKKGWYLNLPDPGERVNVDPRIVAGVVAVPSNVASVATDACEADGYGWLNFLSIKTGGRIAEGVPTSIFKDSQLVGVTEIKAGGTLGVLVRTADGKTVVDSLPPDPTKLGFQGKRTSWRELGE